MEHLNPIVEKYAKIDLSGRRKLAEDEPDIVEFTGFSPELKKNFSSVLVFSSETERVIQERILDKIHAAGILSNIDFFETPKDYPLHATILEGMSNDDEQKRQSIFESLVSEGRLDLLFEQLKGIELEFKYVLIDKGNILLTAIDIPQVIFEVRRLLAQLYEEAGLTVRPLENILHVSIARMKSTPKGADAQKLFLEYKNKMIELRHNISMNPIRAQVVDIKKVPVYNFLTKQD